jgi:hypothetical protein
MLVNSRTGGVVASGLESGYGLTLDDIEDRVSGDRGVSP